MQRIFEIELLNEEEFRKAVMTIRQKLIDARDKKTTLTLELWEDNQKENLGSTQESHNKTRALATT